MSNDISLPAAEVQGSPLSGRQRRSTTTTTAPYTGAWTRSEALHLLRRTMFGAKKADIDHVLTLTMSQAVDELLNNTVTTPAPPLNNYSNASLLDPNVPFGSTWVNDTQTPQTLISARAISLQNWVISQMLSQGISLQQKMTLFWHNHFPTEITTYADARYGYKYYETLRTNALGNFKTLVRAVTTDTAMLIYLNGYANVNTAPDENYARELQELFTVGKGPDSHYTEDDVKAAARVLTGYTLDPATITPVFVPVYHDNTPKQFSAFYNNTVINNTANGGADEIDDLINMILATDECAKYICRRLYRFFVYYEIDSTVETNIITPLATVLRNNNYDIKSVLSVLFKSEHFYDVLNRGCLIKSPIDFYVGYCRELGLVFPDATDLVTQNYMWGLISGIATSASQMILNPPNVAGWPAYYQEPMYHEIWINSTSLPQRQQAVDGLIYVGVTSGGQTLIFDPLAYTATMPTPDDPVALVSDVCSLLLSLDVTQTIKDYLRLILLSGQSSNSYWTNAWNDYVAAPTDVSKKNIVLNRLRPFYQYIMDLPEYHLS